MPHFTIEYSANLDDEIDMAEWLAQIVLSPGYRSGDFNMNGASETADLFL